MDTATKIGIVFAAVFFGALLISIFYYMVKESGEEKKQANDVLDERQKIFRGTGYKIGFWTLVALSLATAILEKFGVIKAEYNLIFSLGVIIISLQVFMTYVILKGADMTPKSILQRTKTGI